MCAELNIKKLAKRVSSSKFQGDDHYSWAVFIDKIPFVTGLSKSEVPYYKQRAVDILMRRVCHG